jgi:hypothetical protein
MLNIFGQCSFTKKNFLLTFGRRAQMVDESVGGGCGVWGTDRKCEYMYFKALQASLL